MQNTYIFSIAVLTVYLALSRIALGLLRNRGVTLFALINVLSMLGMLILLRTDKQIPGVLEPLMASRGMEVLINIAIPCALVFIYIGFIFFQYYLVHRYAYASGVSSLIPILTPIVALILFKVTPLLLIGPILFERGASYIDLSAIGFSFLSFRLSYMAMEVRNRVVPMPIFSEFLSFAFFMPIMLVGPISRYSIFRRSLYTSEPIPVAASVIRIVVGLVKYVFLANMLNGLAFDGLLFDGHPHHSIDLVISCAAYYLFLYCNFSGFCDMAIGFARLLGIEVEENFDSPLKARNIKDFWNRWHITLSTFMRDMLFTPLSKWLVARLGENNLSHAIAIAIFVVFLVIGVWHGVGLNFFFFGLMHAIGVTFNHYGNLWLRKNLGVIRYKAYMNSTPIRIVAVGITFCYVSASFLFFANSMDRIVSIPEILQ